MLWIVLALMAALFLALSDVYLKKALDDKNEYLMTWLRILFTLPLLLAAFFIIEKPALDPAFYKAFIIAVPIEITATVLYVKAIQKSPLSLVLPFLSLTPLFQILFAYLIVGEAVSARGALGILLMAVGSYSLNLGHLKKGLLGPIKAIFREKGSIFMIMVAVLYSFTSALGKKAIMHSSALFFGSTYFFVIAAAFSPITLFNKEARKASGRMDKKKILFIALAGLFYSIMVIFHMTAMSLGKVAYMIAVKRTSVLFGVVFGMLFFGEENIGERFLGALLMFLGLVLIIGAG